MRHPLRDVRDHIVFTNLVSHQASEPEAFMTRRFIVLAAVWTATVGAGLVVQAVPRVQAQQRAPR